MKYKLGTLVSASAVAFAYASIPAFAQEQPASAAGDAPVVEIVVTGSSIRGVAPVGAPVISLGQEEIQNQPAATTTDLLRQVPSVIATGASEAYGGSANNANANSTAGNGINLRGLGTEATLSLVNGRRLPAGGLLGQYFDPSIFPTVAIGRIEVMADGGSAIYGSDAVGGVVNILTRRKYEGGEFFVRQGFNADVQSIQAGGVIGKSWNSGNIMLAYEFFDRGDLKASDRALNTDDLRPYGGADLRLFASNPGNIQIGATRYAIPAGQNGSSLTPSQLIAGTANRESVYKGTSALPGQRRQSLFGSLHQDIAPGIELWSEGLFSYRSVDQLSGALTANLSVPQTNGYFVAPAGAVLPLCPASAGVPAGTRCETVNYSFYKDFGPRARDAFNRVWQIAGGFDAELGSNWKLSGYASLGQDDDSRTFYATNNRQLAAALADSNRATAFNPFGDGSFTNPATLSKILGFQTVASENRLSDFGLKLDGALFALPGGDVKIAVGGEYQRNRFFSYVRDNVATANVDTISFRPSTTRRTVKSAYGELFVPIVSDANGSPGLRELSLSAAVRHDNYSDFGGTTNPKFALSYKPFDSLTLRGTYGTSFRAPTLSDIDPNGLVILIEDFVSPTGPVRTLFVRGGRTGLGPETAKTWSLGFDFKPQSIPGLSASLTYFNVRYTDRIENPGNDRTALSTAAKEALLGSLVTRNPSAALVNSFLTLPQYTGVPEDPANIKALVDGRRSNVGKLNTSGLEGTLQYAFDTGFGQVNMGATGSYVFNFKKSIFPTQSPVDIVDTFGNPVDFRMRANLGVTKDGFTGILYGNYYDGYTNDSIAPAKHINSYTTFDLSLRYTFKLEGMLKGITLSADVQNLFDRDPPVVVNPTPLAFDPQAASILGRFFTVGVRAAF